MVNKKSTKRSSSSISVIARPRFVKWMLMPLQPLEWLFKSWVNCLTITNPCDDLCKHLYWHHKAQKSKLFFSQIIFLKKHRVIHSKLPIHRSMPTTKNGQIRMDHPVRCVSIKNYRSVERDNFILKSHQILFKISHLLIILT